MTRGMNIRVLHVDDEPALAELTAEFLKREDDCFTVKTVRSASEGLEHLSHDDFDCVISDYDMPGQNGIEFLKSVRKKYPDLPFLLFTGQGSEEIAGEAISAGVTDYLQKKSGTDQYAVLANRLRNAVQRHRAEKERKRQRDAIETAQEGISILSEDGEYIYVNQAYADIYGHEPSEINGKNWELTCPDGETAIAQDVIMPTVAADGYWSGETIGLRADGTTFREDHTVAQTDTGELICSVRDRSAEQEQEVELDRFRTVVETLNDPVYVLDETGAFEYVNDAFVEMIGYDRETVVGASPALIKSPEAVDRSETNLGRILSSDGPDSVQFEIEVQPKRGEPIVCEDHMGVLPYDGESFEGSVGILRDVTERKEREAMLRRYKYSYESALSGIAITDLDGELIDVNPAFLDLWRYENKDDVIGRPATELWKDPEQARSVLETVTERGRREDELEALRADGSTFYARGVNSHLTDGDGTPIGVVASFFDITDRKEREAELKRTNTVLRTIAETLPMGVLVEDAEGEVLVANDQLGDTLGVPMDSEELVGRDCAAAAEELADLFVGSEGFMRSIADRIERREPVQNEELPLADGRVIERDYVPYTLPEGEAHLWLYRDVTERKQRKQELDRSRQFLRDTQEVAHIGGWKLDLQSESLWWSDEVYRIHGLSPDADVRIEDAIEFYHSDDRDTIREAVDRLTSDGEPYDVELRIVTVDDDVRWVRALGEPAYEDDELIAVQGTFQDITERKEREQELRMVRERFERFASNVEDAFFLLPTDYSETEYVNPAVETIYGITPEEAYDDPTAWLRHVHPDDKDELLAEMEAQQDETSDWPREQEFRIDHPDRGVRWVQARLDVITDENGDPSQLAGVSTDITEQIKHEQQLEHKTEEMEQLARKYETQYRTLFEEAPVMTILTRSEDGQPIIDDCNSQFAETLGYDADTIIDSELAEFYTPEYAERLQSEGYSQALNGQFTRERRELLTIDGEVIEALLRAVPRRTANGEVIGTVAMYIDISERESVKRANERLEEFTSVVSHDLRNPLNVATGRLELAAEECDSAHLGDLEGALNRIETLIDELLTLAREGKAVTDAQPVHLAMIADECWENVETNQAKLISTIDRDVQADRSRLKQVFENLFRNAVEHGREDVTVTIGELDDGFYIEDDGPGIPSDERDAVFEAGYSRSTNSTGFGLSIVKQIATAHDWQIRIVDGTDSGTRFEITSVELIDK
ncbi:PAS domain S-box protein [Halorubrum sp. ARQ200]|uniref:PAS domain S-box protein n=1 Tax=Halorubrum sp. ARQ200 TaxID=1855872 RepID=UPI0018EE4E4C|nr:PAS domain S-box protein [Halorubrum sp. ARQ200]